MLSVYLIATMVLVSQASITSNLQRHMDRNRILHDLLVAENCPLWESARYRRAVLDDGRASTQLETELIYYQELTDRLIECRKENPPTTSTAPQTTSTAQPTRSTTLSKTSTAPPTKTTAPTSTAPPTKTTAPPTTTPTAPPKTFSASPTTSPAQPSSTRGPAINLALGKEIAANTQNYGGYKPDYIVDGTAENGTNSNSYCNANYGQANSFITIDLGQQYRVREVKLWARPGGGYTFGQVADLEFRVAPTLEGFDNPASLCYYRPGIPTVRPETFTCTQPITGRYVRTLKRSSDHLCFVELEVYE